MGCPVCVSVAVRKSIEGEGDMKAGIHLITCLVWIFKR